jgi:hypothetical protein
VAFDDGRFVVAGDQGMVAASSDLGDSWNIHNLWDHSFGVDAGGGVIIAHGWHWNGSGFDRACFVSVDLGVSYEVCDAVVADSDSFVFDGTRWVTQVAGGFAESMDGTTWTRTDVAGVPGDLLHDGARFYGRNGGEVSAADDPNSWQVLEPDVPGFRSWTVGRVYDENLPVQGVAPCADNR